MSHADAAGVLEDRRRTTRSGWQRLRSALRPHASRGHVLPALLCAVLGFAVVVQVQSTQSAGLDGLRQQDLVRILDDVTARSARLSTEARDLQDTRDKVAGGSDGSRAALEAAQAREQVLGILAGTLPATGPGINLTITDPRNEVGADVLLDTLQELRDAGAEAVEISSPGGPAVRVIASTALVDPSGEGAGPSGGSGSGATPSAGAGTRVVVDGTPLSSPYRFTVIGDPRTLAAALDIPGGVLDVLHQRGAEGVVTQLETATVASLRAAPSPRYARPATP